METMNDRIQKNIDTTPVVINAAQVDGKIIPGKYLVGLHITVKVRINVFEDNFWNGDICTVIAETEDGRLVIQRLEDKYVGIVKKDQVSLPKWEKYIF